MMVFAPAGSPCSGPTIPKSAPNYQAIIKDELLKASVAVVVWTNGSVHSGPAEKANKLFQILL